MLCASPNTISFVAVLRLYEDKLDDKISDERFAKMTATYEQEQKDLSARVTVFRETIAKAKTQRLNIDSFLAQVKKYTEVKELDAEIIRALVERIDVFTPEKVPGSRTKKGRPPPYQVVENFRPAMAVTIKRTGQQHLTFHKKVVR